MPDDLHPNLLPTADPSRVGEPPTTMDGTGASSTWVRKLQALAGDPEGPTIPGFAITGELARGGMGVVYAATDLTLKREVAIKTLLPGADAIRFITESEITARLPHPGIPPVHALGRFDDGAPFLVMKLIRGRTLAALLKERSTPTEDLPRFIAVFEQIAQAVGFAHEQGIIHRDLKPLNVMVGAFGEVQVMDWGLAKDLSASRETESSALAGEDLSHTFAGAIMGTPGYMAPEQARGEPADARADVFALGATLAAILTGKPAFVADTVRDTIEKAARGDLAETLDRLDSSGADAELVAVTTACLDLDPEKRPTDARQVATRIAAYRLGVEERLQQAETAKTEALVREAEGRKRRRAMQWAGGVIAGVLLAGIVGTSLGMNEARRQEGVAKFEAREKGKALNDSQANLEQAKRNLAFAKKGNEILASVFEGLDPAAIATSGRPLQDVLRENLGKAVKELEGSAIGEPLEVALMQDRLGVSLNALGAYRDAVDVLEKSRRTYVELRGVDHPETLPTSGSLATAYMKDGRIDRALPLFIETLALMKAKLGADHVDTLFTMSNMAQTLRRAGKPAEAVPLYEEALGLMRAKFGEGHSETVAAMNGLGGAYGDVGKADRALQLFEEALTSAKANLGDDHPHTHSSVNNLAAAHYSAGRLDKAIPLLEESLRHARKTLGPDHPDALIKLTNLAACYHAAGDFDKAAPLLERALTLRKLKLGDDHPDVLSSMSKLAASFWSLKRLDKSIPLFEEALRLQEQKLGRDHPETLMTLGNLGVNYADAGRLNDAVGLLEEVQRAAARVPVLEWIESPLLETYAKAGDRAKALDLLERRIAKARTSTPSGGSSLAGVLSSGGAAMLTLKEWKVAERVLREAYAIRRKSQPDAWSTFNTQSFLGAALLGQKNYADAEPLLLQAYEGLKARETSIPSYGKIRLPETVDRLVELYTATNKPDEVKKWKAERAKYHTATNKPDEVKKWKAERAKYHADTNAPAPSKNAAKK
jgi:tetratricopeptide (TPR) repeat protein